HRTPGSHLSDYADEPLRHRNGHVALQARRAAEPKAQPGDLCASVATDDRRHRHNRGRLRGGNSNRLLETLELQLQIAPRLLRERQLLLQARHLATQVAPVDGALQSELEVRASAV